MYGRWRSASIARGEEDEMTSLFRLSDSFHSEPEWMDYWSKFWDCGDVAVGRYQHAHTASTYSYTLALSRLPSPSSLLHSFLQLSYPLVLSLPHLPLLPSSHVSPPFFPPSQPFARIIILPFVSPSHSPFLSVYYTLFLFLFTFFPLFSVHSRFQILYLLLLKSYLFVWLPIGFLCTYFHHLHGYIRRDSNHTISLPQWHLFRAKKSFDLYRSFISAPLLAAWHPFFVHASFPGPLFTFFPTRIFLDFPRCCIVLFHAPPFYEILIAVFHRVRIKFHILNTCLSNTWDCFINDRHKFHSVAIHDPFFTCDRRGMQK